MTLCHRIYIRIRFTKPLVQLCALPFLSPSSVVVTGRFLTIPPFSSWLSPLQFPLALTISTAGQVPNPECSLFQPTFPRRETAQIQFSAPFPSYSPFYLPPIIRLSKPRFPSLHFPVLNLFPLKLLVPFRQLPYSHTKIPTHHSLKKNP